MLRGNNYMLRLVYTGRQLYENMCQSVNVLHGKCAIYIFLHVYLLHVA